MLGAPTTHTPTSAGLVPRSSSNPASPHTCRSGTAQSCACAIIGGNQCPRAPSCAVRMPDGSNNSGKSTFVPSLSDRAKQSPGRIAATITDLRPGLTQWPYLRNQPLEHHTNRLFCCLHSMLHGILAALVVPSHCTLHHA